MPQMSPLMWLPLLFMNLTILYMIMTSVHYCMPNEYMTSYMSPLQNSSILNNDSQMKFKNYTHNKWLYLF
nr:TPA_asm: ATP synthase F0 subunit 8 [Pseudomyrmex peperi]